MQLEPLRIPSGDGPPSSSSYNGSTNESIGGCPRKQIDRAFYFLSDGLRTLFGLRNTGRRAKEIVGLRQFLAHEFFQVGNLVAEQIRFAR